MKLGTCLHLCICFIALFIFSGCKFSEEQYSSSKDSDDESNEESSYSPAERYYSNGNRRGRRRSSGGGGGGGSGGGSSFTSVCDRKSAVQSAIMCQLLQNGRLSISNSNGQPAQCNDINSDVLQNNCAGISQSDLGTLEELRINDDLEISSEDFSDLGNLKYLYLINVGLENIPGGVFSSLSKLILLDLSDNEIESVSSDMFSGLSQLEDLVLSGNEISSLSAGVFPNSLVVLDLSDNDLESPLNNFYSNLSSLEELDLSDNDISRSDQNSIKSALSGNDDIEFIFD